MKVLMTENEKNDINQASNIPILLNILISIEYSPSATAEAIILAYRSFLL